MKIIAFAEHYMLPAIAQANPNNSRKIFATMRKESFSDSDLDAG
jgi:hypothetical protein